MESKQESSIATGTETAISQLSEAIKDENKKRRIEEIISSYSKLDHTQLFAKSVYLSQSLQILCEEEAIGLLMNLLNRGSSEGAFNIISKVSDVHLREFLERLVTVYGVSYQWFLDPFPT